MLSFISMGGRKKRQRKKGSRTGSVSGTRRSRRTSRGSDSFMSPGSVGEIVEKSAAKPLVQGDTKGRHVGSRKNRIEVTTSTEVQDIPERSPEIHLEFKHDSLLQSLPEEFLRYRKGSASSSVRDLGTVKSSPQATDWTLNLDGSPQGRRLTQEKRRVGPLPSVAPIKIPASPLKPVPTQSQRCASRARRSVASNSPVWASDSEISPVSGLSAARDVLAESFSFSTRATGFSESSGKEKELTTRMARQDSATLPREAIWEGAIRSPSVSHKSSTHSVKKRKLDTTKVDLPPFEAFILTSPLLRRDEANEKKRTEATIENRPPPPPRKDSMQGNRRVGPIFRGPPPPGLTPSTQKLDQTDQAALHRISRIVETDAEGSSGSSPQPASSSTSRSFSTRSKEDPRLKSQGVTLRSPCKIPSALSTPSTYSKYTLSPYVSPAKRPIPVSAGASSANSDNGNESFLEDFDFVGPSSGGKSGYSGSTGSPYEPQVPVTAATFSSMNGLELTPAIDSLGFPKELSILSSSRTTRSAVGENTKNGKESLSVYTSPSSKGKASASPSHATFHIRNRTGSASSTIANVGKSPISKSNNDRGLSSRSGTDEARVLSSSKASIPREPVPALSVKVYSPGDSGAERHRPSLSRFRVTNAELNPSPVSTSVSPLSCHSPDLLDMLIPDGHIITPISRRQIGRKLPGSTPSPIKITPSRSARYLPMNGDDDDAAVIETRGSRLEGGRQTSDPPSTDEIQTFPETPVLFSPDLAKDGISRSNSLLSPIGQPQALPRSLSQTAMGFQPIVIPSTPQVVEPTKSWFTPSGANHPSSIKGASKFQPSTASNSPPISPLRPLHNSPVASIPNVQILLDTSRPSPPLLGPPPKRRTVHMRPPLLPFGPRKPNSQMGKGTAPLSFAPRRAASESAAGIEQALSQMKMHSKGPEIPLSTPTFKTTSVVWRGLTLDAAKWTFSSAQLQSIVRTAIEQSAQASSIRLLPQDVFEELPAALDNLEARRGEIQKDYKVLVRRRRSIIQRLTSLSSSGPRIDTLAVVRDSEELARITASGDELVEELHDVDGQITQMHRLRDVHQASALAVALRKLNASLVRQTSDTHKLQLDVVNLYAERNEAWRKAEELERELDSISEQAGSSRPKSVSSSRRSSRVSFAMKNSSRTSRAGLRLSSNSYRRSSQASGSSILVHYPTSARTTFSSDIAPPVPPLPILDPPVLTNSSGLLSSHPSTTQPQSSATLSTSDNLYNAVYDLLGVKGSDRVMPSPGRPHSAVYCTTSSAANDHQTQNHDATEMKLTPPWHRDTNTRLRSGSLPTIVPPSQEAEEAGAIIAMLDLRD